MKKEINKRLPFIFLAAILLSACSQPKQETCLLSDGLDSLISEFSGTVGVALICGNDTVSINGNDHFPLFSVVKFHQALAVCEKLRQDQIKLSGETPFEMKVLPQDLKPDTWSPMRQKYPDGGVFPLAVIMEYSLIESDNNACDILFDNFAGPSQVDAFIHDMGITDCGISWTEDEQHADIGRCYDNWSTPLAAAMLMGKFYEGRDVDDYARFIWDTMAKCQTGTGRIPKYIADSVQCIVHKTGTGGMLEDGKVMGINDVACVVRPDGRHFELAVFVKGASCDPASCEELVAEIAKRCFDTLGGR